MRRLIPWLLTVALLPVALAQFQPSNVECIAPANPGGGWDFTCRIPGSQVLQDLGLVPGAVKVTNMPGGGGGVAFANVVTQRQGDNDLLVAASTATATRLAQNVYAGFTEENVRWIGAVGADFGVIAVGSDSPFQSLNDLLEAITEDPNSVVFAGGSAVGGWDHLKVLLVAQAAGIDDLRSIRYVAFDGGGTALIELLGGRAQAFTGDVSEVLSQLEAGNIRVLAVLAPERVAALGDAPTAQEQGFDVIGANWRGFYAPPGISDEAYDYWVNAISTLGQSDEWAELRVQNGLAPFFSIGAEFESFVKEQITSIREISKDLGLIQ